MAQKKQNLLLVSQGSKSREPILKYLRSQTKYIICLTQNVNNWAKQYIDLMIESDFTEPETLTKKLQKELQANNIKLDILICYEDIYQEVASLIAQKMNLLFTPKHLVQNIQNKIKFRQTCVKYGINTPKFFDIDVKRESHTNEEYLKDLMDSNNINFPLVFKLSNGAGKLLSKKIYNIEELINQIKLFKQRIQIQFHPHKMVCQTAQKSQILCEEFISGQEYDLDIVVQNGQILFTSINYNQTPTELYFQETGGIIVPNNQNEDLIQTAQSILNMYEQQLSGVFHLELLRDNQKNIFPLELNIRVGGAETYQMVKKAYEIDLSNYILQISSNEQISKEIPNTQKKQVVSYNFVIKNFSGKCKIQKMIIPDMFSSEKENISYLMFFQENDQIKLPPLGNDYLGWIVVSNDDLQQALLQLRQCVSEFYDSLEIVQLDNNDQ